MPDADAKTKRNCSSRAHRARNAKLAMKGQAAHFRPVLLAQPSGQSACAIIGSEIAGIEKNNPLAADTSTKFPGRPDSDVLSNSIPLFFIAQNKVGLWIAREAEGRTGGIFLFKRSALRFAKISSGASGCATMFLAKRLELDVENDGSRLVVWIGAVLKLLTRYVPEYPPPVLILDRRPKSKWL